MKKLLIIFLLVACALGGRAATTYNITTLTITSAPPALATVTFNGNTRTWSNQTTATLILTNGNVNFCATNLFNGLVDYPLVNPRPNLTWENTNAIGLRASPMVISVSPGWATITSSSSNQLPGVAYTVPIDSLYATNRTNNASDVAYGLSKYSTNALDGVTVTNAKSINGTVNRLTNGVYQTPTLQTPTSTGGVADGLRPTNAIAIHGTNFYQYGGTYDAGTYTNNVFTNVAWINGTVGGTLNGGTYNGGRITNAIGINGTVNKLTGGWYTNGTYDNPISTNLVNYGNAIASPGLMANGSAAADSFQAGSGAAATNQGATALGPFSLAGGVNSTAAGTLAKALLENDMALGPNTLASGGDSLAIMNNAQALAPGSIAIGPDTIVGASHNLSIALGPSAATTQAGQIRLGALTALVDTPGRFNAGSLTNNIFTGTNRNKGDWSDDETTSTSLANGNNVAISSSGVFERWAAGPTAAFAVCGFIAGRNGQVIERWNDTGQTLTVANQSGVDPAAANRIITTTGADVVLGTNSYVTLRYSAARSRWVLRSKF